ncbi:MAG: Gfo/Idh/MocA family oxidoreductase, partial [Gemmatimonadetes bacterium]|nr:Gfo/Idh/MocA family oxidoreductase [Gemmatimonadota bacterium]
MKRIRLGVLSHAHGHINTYCGVLQGQEDVDLVASWDDNIDRGQRAAEKYGLQFRDRIEAVLEDEEIDAVMIGSETNRHADLVEAAAAAGKGILLQKPMATTLADCDRIIGAIDAYGVKFSLAYQMRHDPVNARIKQLLDAGLVGQPAIVRRRHCINV